MERNIISIVGIHGSGKSRLGKKVTEKLESEYSIEHISMGHIIRCIAKGAIQSYFTKEITRHMQENAPGLLDDAIMHRVMSETLDAYHDVDTLIIDGSPRTKAQAEDLDILALQDDRKVAGIIMTTTDDKTAVQRMLLRGPRGSYEADLNRFDAQAKIDDDKVLFDEMNLRSHFSHLPFVVIDTSGDKNATVSKGVETVKTLLLRD